MAEKVTIGNAELWHGDCREILPTLQGVDAIVSDPPYGIAYQRGPGGRSKTWVGPAEDRDKFARSPIAGDAEPFDPAHLRAWPCILFGADHYASRLWCDGVFHVWDKDPRGRMEWDSFSDAELAWTSWRTRRRVFRYLWKGLCQEGAGTKRLHPTMKPVEVMQWCIEMLDKKEQVICDPYMGSASTGVAALRMGRRFIGVECDRRYFDVACERIENEQRQAGLAV